LFGQRFKTDDDDDDEEREERETREKNDLDGWAMIP